MDSKKQTLSPQQRADVLQLNTLIMRSDRICVFTGAGVSCPSGIPDFRSASGIYSQRDGYTYTPEEMVSHNFFHSHTAEFYDFYRKKMVWPHAKPNRFHQYVAALETAGKQVTVVTQNIDGLHQAAGSTRVLELHGSAHRNFCTKCGAAAPLETVLADIPVPRCSVCGGVIKPDVVLYGESLDADVIHGAVNAIAAADLLLVAGTSLAVYPAASFLEYYAGDKLAVLNLTSTPVDRQAAVTLYCDAALAADALLQLL